MLTRTTIYFGSQSTLDAVFRRTLEEGDNDRIKHLVAIAICKRHRARIKNIDDPEEVAAIAMAAMNGYAVEEESVRDLPDFHELEAEIQALRDRGLELEKQSRIAQDAYYRGQQKFDEAVAMIQKVMEKS